VERSVEVATGESVAFSYELAGLGSRFLAVFIDFLIQVTVAVGILLLFVLIGLALPAAKGSTAGTVDKIGDAIVIALFVVLAFILFSGYFIIFETRWNGRTPGKRLVGIRVVRDGGFPVDFTSAVIRNVVRVLEFALGFYVLSAISALLSPQNRRLGDYAAGTIVVRDSAFGSAPAAQLRDQPLEDPLVRELTTSERELVARYAARRAGLALGARAALATKIAAVVRPRLPASFEHLDDDALLQHVAGTLR
jgi:uncharacterized RDD family membrane protein YckC